MDLTEAEDVKKRWQEYTEEMYKKDLHDPDNNHGMITNLDSILKSRDITLTTKVNLVKALVFPVIMYRCESWTIKKAQK